MAEEMIVYRRRPTKIKPHSSLKRKPEKSSRNTDSFQPMTSDPVLGPGVQEQVNEVEEITSSTIYSPRKENTFEKLPSIEENTFLKPETTFKSTESDSYDESSGVVEGNLKQKQGIKTGNDQQSFKDQKNIVAYFGLEVGKLLQSELVDVDLTVQASNRGEKVPFVSLTSESYGKPILGYPLEIGEIPDGSEFLLLSKESVSVARKIYGDKRSRLHQLVWRKSKRTPVCYVTNSLPPKENGVLTKEKSLMRTMKNTSQSNQGKTAPIQTCVPVEVIFRKISSGTILGQHI